MHVLMLCPQFRPVIGGAERQAEKLSKALVRRNIRVTILTPRLIADSPPYEEVDGVAINRFPLFDLCRKLPRSSGLGPLNLLMIRAQVRRAVSSCLNDVDILHASIAGPVTAFATEAARSAGVPVVCKVGMAGAQNDLASTSAMGFGGDRLTRSMVRNMNCWVATTQAVRDTLLQLTIPTDRIAKIPNGVDLVDRLERSDECRAIRNFVYLGRLSTNIRRDVPTLIAAFDRAADCAPDLRLALVGSGDLYDETRALVKQCKHRHQIEMPGETAAEPWLRWAHCFVLPSRQEGLSNALLEAMSFGLPCIANDIPPNREVLDDGRAGVLVPVGDEQRLSDEILKMTTESSYAARMAEAASRRVHCRYAIDAVAKQYVSLYGDLIGGRVAAIR